MKDYDSVAGREFLSPSAYRRNFARGFMAEDARCRMRAGSNLLEVRATDAAGMHAKQQLSRSDLRNGNGFEADVVCTAVDGGEHGRWNRLAAVVDGDLSGNAHLRYALDEI